MNSPHFLARRAVACALAVACAMGASPVRASTTRVTSLGGIAEWLDDPLNVFAYPSLTPDYANTGLADLGRVVAPETYGTLGNLTLTGRAVGGVVEYRGARGLGVGGLMLGREVREQAVPAGLPATGDGVEVLYGRRAGSRVSLGLRGFFAGGASAAREIGRQGDVAREASVRSLAFGAGAMLGSATRLDVTAHTAARDFSLDSTSALGTYALRWRSAGGAPWGVRARLEARLAPDLVARAYGSYARDDFSYDASEETRPLIRARRYAQPWRRSEAGIGLTLDASDEATLLVGAAYDGERLGQEVVVADSVVSDAPRRSTQSPVLVAGAEIRVWPWLAVRAAARKAYTIDERDSVSTDPYCGCVPQHLRLISFPTTFTLGAQFTVRALDVDVQFNDRTPFVQGFYASGAPVVPVIGVSATYHFDDAVRRPRGRRSTR